MRLLRLLRNFWLPRRLLWSLRSWFRSWCRFWNGCRFWFWTSLWRPFVWSLTDVIASVEEGNDFQSKRY
ncbi:unnamed protein product [Dibothriocephalus latus]|uniref:Uncharacterized protein n=1 Tax=Dibothriocephalus latus TaxID=60516 RepID=A0A3P7LB83_DIBLA|nr:unnamed protein product [Dibothriocephalus latus]